MSVPDSVATVAAGERPAAAAAAAIGPIENDDPKQELEAKSKPTSNDIAGSTCMELALEGERLCQSGDLKNGVKFFEEAIKVGTSDDRTLSAIYSQLGNAYFYLEDYQKALDYHKRDVTLVHSIGDEAAEAKACGNLGNTYKMLGKFDEAAIYCRRYLEISRKLNDEIGEGRALYNLGNVYHMQGKRMIGTTEQESGELPPDIKASLQRAIEYYDLNLKVVSKLKDSIAMGRAYGNLGNTHYLLGNFQEAVESHKQRLELARQTNDRSAERRAHLNLGNANVFLGNFSEAIENYSETLKLAQELHDKHTEAHSCYSLANTYTFLRDYQSAIEYHLRYLELIKELDDKLGEGRACWSLVNIYQMVNDPESALTYAKRHYAIAEQLGDETGLASARANIEELEETIAQKQAMQQHQQQQQAASLSFSAANSSSSTSNVTSTTVREVTLPGGPDIALKHRDNDDHDDGESGAASKQSRGRKEPSLLGGRAGQQQQQQRGNLHLHHHQQHSQNVGARTHLSADKRQEQEQRRFKKQLNSNLADIDGLAAARRRGRSSSTALGDGKTPAIAAGGHAARPAGLPRSASSERLFDMIAHFQSGRIDDQRCEILKRPIIPKSSLLASANAGADDKENAAGEANGGSNSGGGGGGGNKKHSTSAQASSTTSLGNPKSAVSAAASAIRATYRKASLAAYPVASQALQTIQSQRRPTVSAEHRDQLFDLIAGAQGQRMDEQRASLPALQLANGVLRNPAQANLLARGQTIDQSSQSSSSASARPGGLGGVGVGAAAASAKPRSRSIVPQSQQTSNIYSPPPPPAPAQQQPLGAVADSATKRATAKIGKLVTKHFQTVDSAEEAPVHDEKFFESLMKYQSKRFDDQRSEFPRTQQQRAQQQQQQHRASGAAIESANAGQSDNFFNLIVKFQSDRIDDQRSAPPASASASAAKGRNA